MKKIIIRKNEETAKAIDAVKKGMPVIFPTETVYGIGALASSKEAVENIYKLKKRDFSKPLGIYLPDFSLVSLYVKEIPDVAYLLAEKYLPGPLTIILKAKENVLPVIRSGKDTIGIRIPDDELTLSFLEKLGEPLAGTSANISGEKSAADAGAAANYFLSGIGAVLDSGPSPLKKESTIVDCSGGRMKIVREGAVDLKINL